jgi:hypothetical protein
MDFRERNPSVYTSNPKEIKKDVGTALSKDGDFEFMRKDRNQ